MARTVGRSPEEVLGLQPGADIALVRKQFRDLARQFHPDVNKGPGIEERFKEISAAYSALTGGGEEDDQWFLIQGGTRVTTKRGDGSTEIVFKDAKMTPITPKARRLGKG